MRCIVILTLLFISMLGQSQVQQVVEAEKSFARYTLDSGIRKGFLAFLDSAGLIFQDGEALSGIKIFSSSAGSSNQLIWEPEFFGVAGSNDIGFTTGPYEVRTHGGDSLIACGQYATVWKKNASGAWKVLLDMGTRYSASRLHKTREKEFKPRSVKSPADTALWVAETNFIRDYQERGTEAFLAHASAAAWFITEGSAPVHTRDAIARQIKALPGTLAFHPSGGATARSADLGYIFGQVIYQGKKQNYLRVWTYERGGWKILLQVIQLPE